MIKFPLAILTVILVTSAVGISNVSAQESVTVPMPQTMADGFVLVDPVITMTPASTTDNVLLLIADDYGVDSMGLYAPTQDVAPTPNLDALAANGVRFTNFWANPICSPTRAAILTGRHGFRTGVGSPQGNNTLPLTEYTLADVMNSRGYHTANFGKWHLGGGNTNSTRPNVMGWDHFEGILGGGVQNYESWSETVNGVTANNTTYATTELTDDAIAWINSKGSDPWFCWLAYNAPHTPFHVPPANLHTQNINNNSSNLEKYKAAVEAMDTEIGRLLNSISPSVLAETTVIFVGDNGTPGQVANQHERGQKGQLYQGGVHTPAIVSGKAVSGPLNRTSDALIHVVDLFATIAELGGYDTATELPFGLHIDSVSAAPYLFDANLPNFHDIAFAERFAATPANQDGKTVRNGQFKYIRFDNGNEALFDLNANGAEANNNNLINSTNLTHVANLAILRDYMDALLASPLAPQVENVVINGGEVQRSTVTEVVVNFNSNVAITEVAAPAFDFTNTGTSQNATYNSNVELVGGKTKVTITFTPGTSVEPRGSLAPTLARGVYQLAVNATQVSSNEGGPLDGDNNGTGGDNYIYGNLPGENLFRIYGDADGNGNVDFIDFSDYFLPAFGTGLGSPGFLDHMDFNGDTNVDFIDFSDGFLPNFGQSP